MVCSLLFVYDEMQQVIFLFCFLYFSVTTHKSVSLVMV